MSYREVEVEVLMGDKVEPYTFNVDNINYSLKQNQQAPTKKSSTQNSGVQITSAVNSAITSFKVSFKKKDFHFKLTVLIIFEIISKGHC